jgi:hypothetical protein
MVTVVSGPEGQARPGCAFVRGKRTAEPTLSSERWFLSGCYPKAALDGAWVDGQIVCDVLVVSAALGRTDDQQAFSDFGVGFLAEGVVEPLSFLQRQADANQGIKVPLVG